MKNAARFLVTTLLYSSFLFANAQELYSSTRPLGPVLVAFDDPDPVDVSSTRVVDHPELSEAALDGLMGLVRVTDQVTYPNPDDGSVRLILDLTKDVSYDLQIVNQMGQSMLREIHASSMDDRRDFKFDMSDLDNGWYFLRVTSSDGEYNSYRILKQQ